jgi:hypothetical protein
MSPLPSGLKSKPTKKLEPGSKQSFPAADMEVITMKQASDI